jgi:glycosyltransferase involved in cell wall biosynthesis
MRILHIVSAIDPLRGGPIIALLGLVQAQKVAGLDVAVASTFLRGESPAAAAELRERGIPVELIGPAFRSLRWHRRIAPVLDHLVPQADIIHIHALWEEINHRAAVLSRRASVPYLVTPHGMLTRWSLGQSRRKKQLYLKWRMRAHLDAASAVHYTTEAERDAGELQLNVPTIVEPLGVDLTEFESLPPPGTFRRKFPQTRSRPLVVFLGRIHPGKGLELLVPAFARAQVGDAMLVIVGPDSEGYRATVEQTVRQHGLQDRVLFTGMLRGPERVAALADATLFALPSFHENFGVAIIEALAAGVPVIISDEVNIHREIAAAGVGGVVGTQVEPLAAELTRWLNDSALRGDAARKARPFIWQHYDWNRIARRWAAHYEMIVGKRPLAAASASN